MHLMLENLEQHNKTYLKSIADLELENTNLKSLNEEQGRLIAQLREQIDKMSESQKYVRLSKILENMHMD